MQPVGGDRCFWNERLSLPIGFVALGAVGCVGKIPLNFKRHGSMGGTA